MEKVHPDSANLLFLSAAVSVPFPNTQAKQRLLSSAWVDKEVSTIVFHDTLIVVIIRIYF